MCAPMVCCALHAAPQAWCSHCGTSSKCGTPRGVALGGFGEHQLLLAQRGQRMGPQGVAQGQAAHWGAGGLGSPISEHCRAVGRGCPHGVGGGGLTAGLSVLQAVYAWPNPSRSHGSPSLESSTKSSAASWRPPTHGRSSSSLTRTISGAEGLGGGGGWDGGCAAGWVGYVCSTEGMHLAAWHGSVGADFQPATWLLSAIELQQHGAQGREICILLALFSLSPTSADPGTPPRCPPALQPCLGLTSSSTSTATSCSSLIHRIV